MDTGLFGPESIVRRVHQETAVVVLSWPRAILLQLAHPLVAAGVAEHSRFQDDPFGRFSAGTQYDAGDPELLLWVHATGLESELSVYDRFVSPLTHDEQEQYYEEMKGPGTLLGIPMSLMPLTLSDLHTYLDQMVGSDQLAVGPTQRALAHSVLHPSLKFVAGAFLEPFVAIILGVLPEKVHSIRHFPLVRAQKRFHAA